MRSLVTVAAAALTAAAMGSCSASAPPQHEKQAPTGATRSPVTASAVPVVNSWLPLRPGMTLVYRERAPGEPTTVDTVTVTGQRRRVGPYVATVVRDQARAGGRVVEDTLDYFAQKPNGDLMYVGESTTDYTVRPPSHEGSWLHGVHGARGGLAMPARPVAGGWYAQENAPKDHARDEARIRGFTASLIVGGRTYRHLLTVEERSPIDPEAHEVKEYAEGVGMVRARNLATGETAELVSVQGGVTRS